LGSASNVAIWLMQGACSMYSLPVESYRLLLIDILTSNQSSAKTRKVPWAEALCAPQRGNRSTVATLVPAPPVPVWSFSCRPVGAGFRRSL